MHIAPYLFFNGNCAEALEFYREALGAEITFMMQFKDAPEPPPEGMNTPEMQNRIMHASWKIGDSEVMSSDGMPGESGNFQSMSLSINLTDIDAAKKYFNALAEGGSVQMPLAQTFFSPCFGTLRDKFGVAWMIYVGEA